MVNVKIYPTNSFFHTMRKSKIMEIIEVKSAYETM